MCYKVMLKEFSMAPEDEIIDNIAIEKSNYLVKERYEVKFDAALPNLNSNGAVAYAVHDKINPSRELFALICDNNCPARLSILPYLKSIEHPNLLNLVEYGVVDYEPKKSRNLALIYKKPTGPKVIDFNPDNPPKINAESFKSQILSMISAIEALKGYSITHRAIRLDNLFYKDSSMSEIVLGDCAASFPGFFQPSSYEVIENLLCLPEGRGNGNTSQDIYAVGVCMLGILLQKEITTSLSTPELLRLKLKKGSYNTIIGEDKISNQFSCVIKAILNDSQEARWTYLQVYNFLEGKPNSSPIQETAEKSTRALVFNNEKFYTPRSAAIAMLNNPQEAFGLIRSGKLAEWVKNGLENEKVFPKLEKLNNQENPSVEDSLLIVSEVCCMLDNTLPLKTGEVTFFPDGLPKAIFYHLKNKKSINEFNIILNSDMIKCWYQEQPNLRAPTNVGEFKLFINRKDFGYGIERIMYDFDDDLPCTSPLIGNEFVNSAPKLLRALDNNYKNIRNNEQPYDRNVIAFLRCKMGNKIDGILTDLNSRQDNLKASAVLRLYTNIQNKNGPALLPNLAQWLVSICLPIIKNYHNIKYQKYLERKITRVSKSGKLVEMYEILENDEAKQKDRSEYSEALKNISYLVTERNKITNGSSKIDEEARNLSIRFASITAILAMTTSFILSLIYWVLK